MSSQNISPEEWLGKLVWYFPRDEVGLPISNQAISGIVIDISTSSLYKDNREIYIVLSGTERYEAWKGDLELVEEWSEDLEGKNSSMEKA